MSGITKCELLMEMVYKLSNERIKMSLMNGFSMCFLLSLNLKE